MCQQRASDEKYIFPSWEDLRFQVFSCLASELKKKKILSLHLMFLIDSASIFHFDLLRDFRFNLFEKVYFEKYFL